MGFLFQETTGETDRFNKEYRNAAILLIQAKIEQGQKYIVLREIYSVLNAKVDKRQNGIQHAIEVCKKKKMIKEIKGELGVYRVMRP
jgi:hypothetical protein